METYDYIIVGGGSSGCVLANRLVSAGKRVLLLEAGPRDNTPFIHIPATFVRVLGTKRTWMYRTEPEPGANGRVLTVPQGRTLGGGSSVNAMIYIRGQAEDYDTWRDLGCAGWGYDDVLPVFRRSEDNETFSNTFHGVGGLLKVSEPRYRHPISSAFVRAAQEVGLPHNADFNGAVQAGVGFYQTTTFRARRGSTAATYLKPVRHSKLLTVHVEAAAQGVVLENGAAVGIRYRHAGRIVEARAREEVVLCAGALATPKLLMLSGIGPEAELRGLDIPVTRHLPGVGENFQDHITASVYGITDRPISLKGQDRGLHAVKNGLQYVFTRSGLLTSNVVETGGFVDTSGQGRADIQFHVTPALVGDATREAMAGHGVSINPCILRPASRGKVSLRSRDAGDPIVFVGNNLTQQDDLDTLVRGLKLARRILGAPSMRALGFRELAPGDGDRSNAELERHARSFAKTVYHPAGTCKMGTDDMAVVDNRLRVIGVPRLRVADASIMPTLVSGNTNAPCIMIAERCADFLLARTPG
ncbi:GMC family oxidoreductase N-terminal domain-containing protein [Mesorhizobium sp. AD1-1]|uniref:GMC family oxidoreductase n=1 Tax=Mesorhizobium sp. AD1-1 TaxID=2876621 RepID=UPI001CC9FBAF|nr:GMC family oxidoreductase N-terminal domain-containing protein [Mesorhizobium sp. AD1-1]MBZ9719666.1 GMC family oxidoreductase N-terminal domain-containing protein [Mesorhizobium sp. AD1-1]